MIKRIHHGTRIIAIKETLEIKMPLGTNKLLERAIMVIIE
jgi:hypothetical protein